MGIWGTMHHDLDLHNNEIFVKLISHQQLTDNQSPADTHLKHHLT